jgi:oligopeptide transport system ATP-binding protein
MTLLNLENLSTHFQTKQGNIWAVRDISLTINPGEAVGIVGESGSGKTQLFLSALGLLSKNGGTTGHAFFHEKDLLLLSSKELNQIRGRHISMIFQDPMTALNPYLTIEAQMIEVLTHHQHFSVAEARASVLQMLEKVGITDPESRLKMYPHEISGGMRQRIIIGMSLLCQPELLIADEPTTALDPTIQTQILSLLRDLKKTLKTALVIISHDLGVVSSLCDRVCVMYAGRIVEEGPLREVLRSPQHPYTQGLVQSIPHLKQPLNQPLPTILGHPPEATQEIRGCPFYSRCYLRGDECQVTDPPLTPRKPGRKVACHRI